MTYASKEIENFIENFPKEENYIQYDTKNYKGEMADFLKGIYEVNPGLCLSFYARQENNTYFEIAHPTRNHIRTRAVYSAPIYSTWINTIFFIDENNQYPWVYIEAIDLHVIVTPEKVFNFHTDFGLLPSLDLIQSFLKGKEEELRFRDISWGFSLSKKWPMHYFYETLPTFMALNTNKNILDAPSYFIPKKYWNKKTKDKVYFTFNGIGFWQLLNANLMPEYMNDCAQKVYEEAMQDFDELVKKDDRHYDLVLWISLTSSFWGRCWMEQIEGFLNIIKEFTKSFKNIKIYYDGFTSYEPIKLQDSHSIALEVQTQFMTEFKNLNLNDRVVVESLNDLNFREKICYASTIDLAFAEPGSAGVIPGFITQRPCVFFGNSRLWMMPLMRPTKFTKSVSHEYILTDSFMPEMKEAGGGPEAGYHIPWQHIYNLGAEILEELFKSRGQNIFLYRLAVPNVKFIAKQYELLQKQNEFHLNADEPLRSSDNQKANSYFIDFIAYELIEKDKLIEELENQNINLNTEIQSLQNENTNLHNKMSSVAQQSAKEDLNIKKLQVKELEKKLGLKLSKLEPSVNLILNESLRTSAVARIKNQLAYRLGTAIIDNSKSFLGYIRMFYVLSYIKDKYKTEQKAYQTLIKQKPELKLPKLETYSDYNEALKVKKHLSYKLGESLIKADKTWYKGGYIKFFFEMLKLIKEFRKIKT